MDKLRYKRVGGHAAKDQNQIRGLINFYSPEKEGFLEGAGAYLRGAK